MVPLLVNIDTTKAFTLFEACPEARCQNPEGVAPVPCSRCGGRRGRQQVFESLAELREYLRTLPGTMHSSWPVIAAPNRP